MNNPTQKREWQVIETSIQRSDEILLSLLEKLEPKDREKLLLVLRKLVHRRNYKRIDAQLRKARKTSADKNE